MAASQEVGQETIGTLTPDYLLDLTEQDLDAAKAFVLTKTELPQTDPNYPGCKQIKLAYADKSVGTDLAILVVSPDTGKIYLGSRFGDVQDFGYMRRIVTEVKAQ
jgi:hypothetical protein